MALFSLGFRPFFLGACLWAGLSMVGWLAMLSGAVMVPTGFDPASWHAHEMLFGYLGAVFAGFLLTAVPNWTGRPPLTGLWLVVLAGLWGAGRVAVFTSIYLPPLFVLLADLSLIFVLVVYLGREIVAAKNWRNLGVIAMLFLFIVANGLFHLEAWQGDYAAGGYGFRLGIGVAIMLIALVGGRIVPAFTQNWLRQRQVPPKEVWWPGLDMIVMAVSGLTLTGWVLLGVNEAVAWALVVMGFLHALRLSRWRGHLTHEEPLVWVLHIGYGLVPLGALALGLSVLQPGLMHLATAQHIWMAGAIGVMTLAVMTRASLGHSGQALKAGWGTTLLYVSLIVAVCLRLVGPYAGDQGLGVYLLSALFWCSAFFGFVFVYGPALLRPRPS